MLRVLLDSNIYRRDLTLAGAQFRLLFAQAGAGEFHVVLPEVVAMETGQLYRREVEERLGEVVRAGTRLRRLQIPASDQEAVDLAAASEAFRERLEALIVDGGGEILPLPEIPHGELVDRAVRRRKPFRDKGTGYRDALIWQNALDLAKAGDTVALVTDNHKDFAGPDGLTLDRGLAEELEHAGAQADSVVLYKDLDAFFEARAARADAALKRVRERIGKEETLAALEDRLATALAQYQLPDEGRRFLMSVGIDSEGAWIDTLDSIEHIEANEAYLLGEEDAAVDLTVTVTATVDFLTWKGDAYSLERRHEFGDEIDLPVYFYDYDYNESFAAGETHVPLEIAAQATFRAEPEDIEEVEVIGVEPG